MTERLARDQKVVSPDRFTYAFEGCANTPRVVGVLSGEVKDLKRTGQERRDAFGVRLGSLTLGNPVPEFEQDD
jgi:hypothetical protein